jgi:tetraacyldisaccharide-1-P 4'-kinase
MRPLDLTWVLAPLLADARPRALVLVESVSPPVLSRAVRRLGAPVLRYSGRVGPRSRWFGALWAALAPCDHVLARDGHEAAFLSRWFPTEVAGDGKLGQSVPNPLVGAPRYAVGASTRAGDEQRLLDAVEGPLVLAPREPARFDGVAGLLDRSGRSWVRRSRLPDGRWPPGVEIVLLDTVGELAGVLRGARVAFAGGSFSPSPGAHAPAEAFAAGVPVVAGPFGGRNETALAAARRTDEAGLRRALAEPGVAAPALPDPTSRGVAAVGALERVARELSPRPWARPLGPFVALAARRRAGGWTAPVPVVGVGSRNARGPGRTSLARWLVRALGRDGRRVGAVARGIGRVAPGLRVSDGQATWRELGDEGALLARDGALVAVGPDRRAAVERLVALGADVIVLDDGLGAHGVDLTLAIEVVDARFPSARGPLPAGERRPWLRPPDRTVWTHVEPRFPAPAAVAVASARPGPWHSGAPAGPVAAVAGLGRQADLLRFGDLCVDRFLALRDHCPVDAQRAASIAAWAGGLPVVTTAKDAIRWEGAVCWRDIELDVVGLDIAL